MNLQVFCMDETIALLFINMNFSWSYSSWSKSSIVLRKRERTEKKNPNKYYNLLKTKQILCILKLSLSLLLFAPCYFRRSPFANGCVLT